MVLKVIEALEKTLSVRKATQNFYHVYIALNSKDLQLLCTF